MLSGTINDPKAGKYRDEEDNYVNIDTVCTVVQEGRYMPDKYLNLQDVFYQKTNGKWELNKYHIVFCT